MDEKKTTKRISVTFLEEDLDYYAGVTRAQGMKGKRITVAELIRGAVGDDIRRRKGQR